MMNSVRMSLTACRLSGWLIAGLVLFVANGPARAAEKTKTDAAKVRPMELPDTIAAEAVRRGIELTDVKRQGDYWVACKGEGDAAACTVLGRIAQPTSVVTPSPVRLTSLSSSAILEVHRYGEALQTISLDDGRALGRVTRSASQGITFELNAGVEARVSVQGMQHQLVDSLPRYRKEGKNLVRTKDLSLVRDYIDSHPSEPFLVIVSVPALCEPCRRLDKMVQESVGAAARTNSSAKDRAGSPTSALPMKMFILEYFSFADAERELLGAGAVFPTTLVFGVETQPRKSLSRLIGNLRGSSIEEISRPLAQRFRRGAPHTMSRGVIVKDLLVAPQ